MINPDDLIPPDSELARLLLQWTEDQDTRTWSVANLTNELIFELEGGVATKADIYKAVAARCKGKKPNTIRRWAEVAADFDAGAQERYAALLSFDHFKVSRRLFHEGYTPSITYGLEWCVSGNDDKTTAGKFHTVSEMLANFLPNDGETSQLVRSWNKAKEGLWDSFLMVDHDNYREKLLDHWRAINYIIGQIEALDKKE